MNNLPVNVAIPITLGTVSGWLASLFSNGEAVPALTSVITVLFTTLLRAYFDRQRDARQAAARDAEMRQYLALLVATKDQTNDAK